jgi:hypothetical protein
MMPSPVPPYRCTTIDDRLISWVIISRKGATPTTTAISIECTTSANNTVTCLNSAGSGDTAMGEPQA